MDISSGKQRDYQITIPDCRTTIYGPLFSQTCKVLEIGGNWLMKVEKSNDWAASILSFIIQVDLEKLPIAQQFQFRVTASMYDEMGDRDIHSYDSGWKNIENVSTVLTTRKTYLSQVQATLSIKRIQQLPLEVAIRNYAAQPLADVPSMFGDRKYSDFTFIVGKKHFKVHKIILGSASEVFDKLFTADMEEQRKGQCKVVDIKPDIFEYLLRFIYGVGLPANLGNVSMKLFEAAHYYDIKSLADICCLQVTSTLTKENAVAIFEWASLFEQEDLKTASWIIIKRDILEINCELEEEPLPLNTIQRLVNEKKFFESLKKKPKIM